MNLRKNRNNAVFALALIFFMSFSFFIPPRAWGLTMEEVRSLVGESVRLLITNKGSSPEQQQKIQDLGQMIKGGEISDKEIHQMVKEQLAIDLVKYKLSKYNIAPMFARVPKLIPSLTSDEFENIMTEVFIEKIPTITFKVATLAPEGTVWADFMKNTIAPLLTKRTKGQLVLKQYFGGVMGEDVDILRKIDMGQLDGCGCTALGALKAAPELSVITLPRLFRNYEEVDFILNKFRKDFDGFLDKKGYSFSPMIDTGFFYMYTKNKISSLDDLKKQKPLTWFGTVETATYAELGIHPTVVAVPEVLASLNTGLVNANCGPPAWMLGSQAYTSVNYYIDEPFFYSIAGNITSAKFHEKFAPELRPLVANSQILVNYILDSLEPEFKAKLRPFEKRTMDAFRNYGIKPIKLSQNDMMALDAASRRVWDKLADKLYPRDLLNRIVKELEKHRNQE